MANEMRYCPYCKRKTPHKLVGAGKGANAGNKDYRCLKCGSANPTIQGFAADLM